MSALGIMIQKGSRGQMYYFIVNATSRTGKAKKFWVDVERELKRRKISYEAYVTKYEGHAKELADKLCTKALEYKEKHGQDAKVSIVVLGGDGTANEVINGMHHFAEVNFGYIATGSGNDLGRGLGISKNSLEALNRVLESEEIYKMDLGCLTYGGDIKRYFAISSGIGMDADVCRLSLTSGLKKILNSIGMGSLTYVLLTIKALFTMPTTDVIATFDDNAPKKIKKMIFVAGMNHPWEGGGVPMAPKADAGDGKLSVCCIYGLNRLQAFCKLPLLVMGKQEGVKGVEIIDCEKYELKLKKPMVLHADGEYLGTDTKIGYSCEKGKLRVLI